MAVIDWIEMKASSELFSDYVKPIGDEQPRTRQTKRRDGKSPGRGGRPWLVPRCALHTHKNAVQDRWEQAR